MRERRHGAHRVLPDMRTDTEGPGVQRESSLCAQFSGDDPISPFRVRPSRFLAPSFGAFLRAVSDLLTAHRFCDLAVLGVRPYGSRVIELGHYDVEVFVCRMPPQESRERMARKTKKKRETYRDCREECPGPHLPRWMSQFTTQPQTA